MASRVTRVIARIAASSLICFNVSLAERSANAGTPEEFERSCMAHSFKDRFPPELRTGFCKCTAVAIEKLKLNAEIAIPYCIGITDATAMARRQARGSANAYDVLQEMIRQNGMNFRKMIE